MSTFPEQSPGNFDAGNSINLAVTAVIYFAMLPDQRFWRETVGAFHSVKKTGNFGGSKSAISDWSKVVPFGRKPRYVAVPDRGPGTGTIYEKRKWNTTFRSEIPTGYLPVGRTHETCSIYRRTGNSGNFD